MGTTSCGGGTSDLVCDIKCPDNRPLTWPVWIATEADSANNTDIDSTANNDDGQA